MSPGYKINAIFMICRINQFVDYTDVLKTNLTDFLNKITSLVHQCAFKWDGRANKTDGNKYVITWELPDIESASNDAERIESRQEQRTEMADKSLVAVIKIISEIRRANQFNIYFRKNQMVQRVCSMTRPYLTFGLHLGWAIQGAIGSDNKIDACYLSPHLHIASRLEELTSTYDMQIILSETLYNYMSLKARNTLRKIDVILLNTFANQGLQNQMEPMGLYTFDMSFDNAEISTISEDHQAGDLIKLSQYETINIENF
jgi:class 3 adenylate cyclase